MRLASLAVAALLLGAAASPGADENKPRPGDRRDEDRGPRAGSPAPDFVVKGMDGKTTVKLSGLRGKPVVLFFGSCT